MNPIALNRPDFQAVRAAIPASVVHRSFVAETVLLNIETGRYHGMDEVGGRFFDALQASPSVEAAVVALAREYGQPVDRIRADMLAFCSELLELGLIEFEPARSEP